MFNREYHIHHIPVFVFGETEPQVNIPTFCEQIIEMLPRCVLRNVDVCYISDNPVLDGRNAAYSDGAIYMKLDEPTNEDMIENFVHEVAHAVELEDPHFIYDDRLIAEFAGKRSRLYHLLTAEGFDEMPQRRYDYLEYNEAFDNFAVAGAGLFGETDKLELASRRQWVIDNADKIISTANNPLEDTFWCQADKPFSFLAWCIEYRDFAKKS